MLIVFFGAFHGHAVGRAAGFGDRSAGAGVALSRGLLITGRSWAGGDGRPYCITSCNGAGRARALRADRCYRPGGLRHEASSDGACYLVSRRRADAGPAESCETVGTAAGPSVWNLVVKAVYVNQSVCSMLRPESRNEDGGW